MGGAFRPSLHPGGHSAPDKKRQAQAFAAVGQGCYGITPQLLVLGNQIVTGGR